MLSDTPGVHHVSGIVGDGEANVGFYAGTLGLRFLIRTVNFQDKFTYHLYYGDRTSTPGTVLTSFVYPGEVEGRDGKPAISAAHLAVPEGSLDWWAERLGERGAETGDPTTRLGEDALAVFDPAGTRLELVEREVGIDAEPFTERVPEQYAIRGISGVSVRSASPYVTASLLETLGFEHAGEEENRVRYRTEGRGTAVDLLTDEAAYSREGTGSLHHLAVSVGSLDELQEWRDLLDEREFDVSRVKDRHFFHSLYVRDSGGVLVELATEKPGPGIDPEGRPGDELFLPPWFEEDRDMIEPQLPELNPP